MPDHLSTALADLGSSLRHWRLWTLLGWVEIRQRYARSVLGPFWLTLSLGLMVATLGLVYSALLKLDVRHYLPLLATGLVLWQLLAGIINEGCMAYIQSAGYIRQIPAPRLVFALQSIWRNLVVFAQNAVILLPVLLLRGSGGWGWLWLFPPALLLFVLNASWVAALLGLLAARFRDLPQIVASLLQMSFYITPILFQPEMLGPRQRWLVALNPLSYLFELVRQPLLGQPPSLLSWQVAGAMAALGWLLTLALYARYLRRLPFWV